MSFVTSILGLQGRRSLKASPSSRRAALRKELRLESLEGRSMLAAIPLTNTTYAQNFDALASTGTGTGGELTGLLDGWYTAESGTGANTIYTAGTGSGNVGDTYSFGSAGSTERALGGLRSGSVIPTIGAQFRNDNAGTITQLNVGYRGEEWRLGTAGRADRLDFQYSTDATSLTTGTWTDFNALDFATPDTAGTGAKDGNAINTSISGSITSLGILPSATFWIRWSDIDASGSDDGLAVDDFSITAVTGVPAASLVVVQSGNSTSVTEGGNNDSFTVALNRNPTADVTVTLTPANNQIDLGSGAGIARVLTFTASNGTTSQTVTVTAIDDAVVEGNQAVAITIATTSSDTAFNALTTPNVNVNVVDNDFVGLIPPQTNDFATVAGSAGLGLGWTVQSVDTDTANTWFAATVDGNRLAEANGFGDAAPANDWLISPPINLDTTTGEVARFDSFTRFADSGTTPPALRFRYSTNYSGLGDPTAATWTDLTFAVPTITDPLTSSGNIDISGITGTLVWFAFQYTSSGTTGSTSTQWRVDNFSIQPGTAAPAFAIASTDANKFEGNSGSTPFTFTVTRSGNTTGADTVDFAVTSAATDGATAPDFAGAALPTGTVSFADGEVSKLITINVAGDTDQEANEGFIVTLSNASRSGTLATATANGTIRDDDAPAPTVWINEIHYDNIGTDAGEFVELAGTAGANLTGWSIVLYNGSGGASYVTIPGAGTIDNEDAGFGALDFRVATTAIQNGNPDGLALVNNLGVVVEFLSYGGTFTATNGPANGMTSTDIGLTESNTTTPVGFSLQRKNTVPGTPGVWGGPFDDSPGTLNVFPAPAFSIAATDAVKSEGNTGTTTFLFAVTRSGDISLANDVSFAIAGSTTNAANATDFVGAAFPTGTVSFAAGETSKVITVGVAGDTAVEPDEGFVVTLSNPTAGAVITTPTAEGTIQNDDTATNQAPVANDDSLTSIAEDSGIRTITIASLIANDTDPNGDTLNITAVSNPVGGTVSISGTDVLFTPTLNFNGPASFEYTLSDGSLTDTGAVNFTVTPVNDLPLAQPSSVATTEDTTKTFAASDFLFTDVENDSLSSITITGLTLAVGDLLTVNQGTGPTPVGVNTTVTAAQLATLTYRPAANASGSPRSTFQFRVNDADLGTVAAVMNLNVSATNDVPVANNIRLTAGSTTTVANGAEISAFDKVTKKLFITKNDGGVPSLDVIDLTNPASPGAPVNINLTAFGGSISSVAAKDGLVVAAMIAATKTAPGTVVFINAATQTILASVAVTSQPDMITFTPDGSKVLVAIEGEAADNVTPAVNNPEGGVAIITLNLSNLSSSAVSFAGFSSFNAQKAALVASGVRLLNNASVSVAMDLEPEYIAVSADGTTARVTLQEANAFGLLDLSTGAFTSIQPLGAKDYSLPGNEIDASDRDVPGASNNPVAGNLRSWPVSGLYMPDAVASFTVAGQTYFVTANEGDARPNAADTADTDVIRVSAANLDPTVFPNAIFLKDNDNLGRLNVLTDGDTDNDGDLDRLISLGGRSFTIWDSTGAKLFDSGSDFERITFAQTPTFFNANNGVATAVDQRSDDKGPEPEGVVTGEINGRTYAFIGLERSGGGVMVYDVTAPTAPVFVQYIRKGGDISPEGIVFISSADSPNGRPLLVLSNEVSGTVTVYQIATASVTTNEDIALTFAASDFLFTDIEGDSLASITISGLSLASGDTLKLSGTDVVVNQTITAADIANLVYTPALNANGLGRSSFNYRVNDAGTGVVGATMTINVTALNDSPVFSPANYTFQIAENSPTGTVVGNVSATDPDLGTTLTYSLSGIDASKFVINATTGQITVAAGTVLDFEVTNQYSISAVVTDGTLIVSAAVTINVTNVNETPVFAPPSYTFSLAENSATGTPVGTVTATDPESGTLTYGLSGSANFVINATTGVIAVAAGAVLNFEGTNIFSLTADVSDGNSSVSAPVTINLTNVNEAPIITSGNSFSVVEANTLGQIGPSSSATPYLTSTDPNVQFTSIMTVGDAVSGYRMVGIPDGMGAFDNGDGTFTLLMNHEINNTLGIARAHGQPGAFVSRWVINKSTLQVVSIQDFLQNGTSVYLSDNNQSTNTVHSAYLAAATTIISRLCSADLAPINAYQWDNGAGSVFGTSARIFQSGEESGGSVIGVGPETTTFFGRQFAFVATDDPNTTLNEVGTAWELPHAGIFAWENNLANPFSQRKTIVVGMDDTSPGQVYIWVGDKQTTGNVVERAGLTKKSANDNLFVVKVTGLVPDATGATNETRGTPLNGSFTLENEGDVSGLTGAQLEALSDSKGGTQFLRPEDGQWDPANPSDFYFVTTDQFDQTKAGVGSNVGRSRLYRLRFTDIANPELGGAITALLDGTEGGNMFDNMTLSNGKVIIQEDIGNQQTVGKVWSYDIATDTLTQLAQHDRARFGDVGIAAIAPFSQDEESSGVIDVSDILGAGSYLLNVQAHYPIPGELVEGGQLLMMRTNVSSGSQFVATILATDADANSTLTYSINGGADSAKFSIDSTTGRLSLVVAPNFETPTDAGANNVYDVTVSVSDGVNSSTQAIQVTVTAVNESPTNTTAAAISVAENVIAVTTVSGTDPEKATLSYAISGGADAAKFTIDSVSGALSFLTAPNFEAPTDNGANNSYFVTVTVSDGVNPPVNKVLTITVTNATELVSVVVNGGQRQRSQITSVQVTTDSPLSNPQTAFGFTNIGLFVAGSSSLLTSQFLVSASGNVYTITFNSVSGLIGVVERGAAGDSLDDGNWVLSIDQAQVSGKRMFGDLATDMFFRMFGDSDGDGDVDGTDTLAFRRAQTSYNSALDYDGNGAVTFGTVDSIFFNSNSTKRRRSF